MPSEIDWSQIAAALPKRANYRVNVQLSIMDYWILKAAARAKMRSLAPDCASLLAAQVRRHEEQWLRQIQFLADQDGVSIEEKFIELATEGLTDDTKEDN